MSETSTDTRLTASRFVEATAADVFAVLCDPEDHVDIDASGMLQTATGSPVTAVGDRFVIHMDREALGDYPTGRYGYLLEPATVDDVAGTWVTSVYDWSVAREKWLPIFPVINEANLRATLGILDRVVARRARLG